MREATNSQHSYDEHIDRRDDDHDHVGTVEVQILLSWFFESASPSEASIDVPRAA